ncbi:MAG TPA: dihydrolipoyl dehydrogenase [Gammaproteobacteria bacterium]|nr:dihydrolipoyl dehydrogenase [Gammaproteobacteria bacterium]
MANIIEIKVPDIGNFKDVDVIDVLVKPGDKIEKEQGLITIETDKAAMDVPSPQAGMVKEVKLKQGDKASEGTVVLTLEVSEEAAVPKKEEKKPVAAASSSPSPQPAPARGAGVNAEAESKPAAPAPAAANAPEYKGKHDIECQIVVLGSGPGGYAAAFRAADLGLQTVLVERYPVLGGVCLNVGCIPSKALLHAAKVIEDAEAMAVNGIEFGKPKIDLDKLRGFKEKVVKQSVNGLDMLAKQRKVQVVQGVGKFVGPHHLQTENDGKKTVIKFEQCIIAAGSEPTRIPGLPDDPRIMDSTGALELADLPERLLVIGGGIIGLEMACVYDALGVKVTVVELTPTLIPGADRDVVRPLEQRIKKRYEQILLGVKVSKLEATKQGIKATFEGDGAPAAQTYGRVLVAVGRRPNGKSLDAGKAGVNVDERGFIPVDKQMRTSAPNIFAIGDVIGNPMLAHKASHEGHIAAEVAAGHKRFYDARVIPSVAYTDPEVAWVGLTETEAKEKGIAYGKGVFPWAASGRARSIDRTDGLTKLIFEEGTERIIGAATAGVNAGELIGELALAIEMGCNAEDIGLTIHAHPTLHESVMLAAEVFEGTVTDLYAPKKAR